VETIQNPNFTLAVECSDLILQIRVNDIILFKNVGERKTSCRWINDFIFDGENTIEVSAELPAHLANSGVEPPLSSSARVILQKNDIPVYRFLYPQDPPLGLPSVDSSEFRSETQHGLWSWQRSDEIELNEEATRTATTHLRRLINACEAKDVEQVIEIFQIKNRERAIAFYRDEEDYFQQEHKFFDERLNNPVWELEPVNDESIQYELCGKRRVVVAKILDSDNVLKWIDYKGMNTDIPLYLSMMNGQWMIVR